MIMIATWKELNESIAGMSEADIEAALLAEASGKRRWTIIRRLHQRQCALRASRERAALKALCAKIADTPPPLPAPTTPSPYPGDPPVMPDL